MSITPPGSGPITRAPLSSQQETWDHTDSKSVKVQTNVLNTLTLELPNTPRQYTQLDEYHGSYGIFVPVVIGPCGEKNSRPMAARELRAIRPREPQFLDETGRAKRLERRLAY